MSSLWLDRSPSIETDARSRPDFDEIIVGAGITGLITAVLLARAGRRGARGSDGRRRRDRQHDGEAERAAGRAPAEDQRALHGRRRCTPTCARTSPVDAGCSTSPKAMALPCNVATPSASHRRRMARRPSRRISPRLDSRARRHTGGGRGFALPHFRSGAAGRPGRVRSDAAARRSRGRGALARRRDPRRRARDRCERPATGAGPHGSRGVQRERLVLATGTPMLDRGLYFAKLAAKRSYAASYRVPGSLPLDMYLSVDEPSRSIRTTPEGDGELLLVGGYGHAVGREPSPASRRDELFAWTESTWPGAERTHDWSAQDYETPHGVPFVGWLPRSGGRIFLATGYDKWGMTNAAQCAMTLAGDLLGGTPEWAAVLHHRVTLPAAIGRGIGMNAAVAKHYAVGWTRALVHRLRIDASRGRRRRRPGRHRPRRRIDRRRTHLPRHRNLPAPGRDPHVERCRGELGLPRSRVPVRGIRRTAGGAGHPRPAPPLSASRRASVPFSGPLGVSTADLAPRGSGRR